MSAPRFEKCEFIHLCRLVVSERCRVQRDGCGALPSYSTRAVSGGSGLRRWMGRSASDRLLRVGYRIQRRCSSGDIDRLFGALDELARRIRVAICPRRIAI